METQGVTRGAGILLAISSLPSAYGIGTLGNEAFRFIDLLVDLKQKYWQVLPIGPTSFGDSPYQAMSAFAGNPYLIDLDLLAEEGLLKPEEIRSFHWGSDSSEIDYAVIFENRYKVLRIAYERFKKNDQNFQKFCTENDYWIGDYALYMSIKCVNHNRNWSEWDSKLKYRDAGELAHCTKELYNDIEFWKFCQYKFFEQWEAVKKYANSRGIQIIGDVAFYIGFDSADVWAHRNLFLLDEDGNPTYLAAAVPDKFSEEGQIWGNPVYNWTELENEGFEWWKKRITFRKKLFDIVRMDHFVGMAKNFVVPAGATSTSSGKWLKVPGKHLVTAINEALDGTPAIADDYGGKAPIPGVKKLLTKSGWLGTKVLLFAFDGNTANEHLPHNYADQSSSVYAGTHDNETIVGYFRDKTEYELAYLYEYLGISQKSQIPDSLIRQAYASIADIAVIQMQDVLLLGNEARMNVPSTVGNWRWRLKREQLDETRRAWIRNLVAVYRR